MRKKKNVLILGATGFIGKNLIEHFQKKKKFNIVATYHTKKKINKYKVKWKKVDLCNPNQVNKILKNIDVLIQGAAATSGAKEIVNNPQKHVTDNAIMNSYIMKSAYENNVKHVIFFSCTVMYPSSKYPLKENSIELNKKIDKKYFGVGHTKLYIEKICEFFSRLGITKYTCIRHSNVYGPNDKFSLDKGHFFASNLLKISRTRNNQITIWGKGNEKRDLLYITDLNNFVDKVIKYQKNNFEIFNCTYGKSFKVIDVIKKMIKHTKKNIKVNYDLSKPSIPINILVSSNKAKKILGWKRKISLDDGIKKTTQWLEKNI
tara:strand:+ start:4127 stop:5080 length:954 start_codon:yes stop_codon:yes gene_type:complete